MGNSTVENHSHFSGKKNYSVRGKLLSDRCVQGDADGKMTNSVGPDLGLHCLLTYLSLILSILTDDTYLR